DDRALDVGVGGEVLLDLARKRETVRAVGARLGARLRRELAVPLGPFPDREPRVGSDAVGPGTRDELRAVGEVLRDVVREIEREVHAQASTRTAVAMSPSAWSISPTMSVLQRCGSVSAASRAASRSGIANRRSR